MRLLRLPLILCLLAPALLQAQSNLVLIVGPDCNLPFQNRTILGTDANDINVVGSPSAFLVGANGVNISFAAPNGADLTVGQYSNTTALVENGNLPRLDLQGLACNCTNLTGHFEILELHTNITGAIDRFWATFALQCVAPRGLIPGATGEVRFCSAFAPPPPAPRTLHVPSEYSTIQAAIDDASYVTTDTVLVAPGNYPEPVKFRAKPVALVSEAGPEQTHIAPSPFSTSVMLDNDSDKALLGGFTLDGGFRVDSGRPTVITNIITGSNTFSAIVSSPIIRNNHFRGMVGSALYLAGQAEPLIEGNLIEESGTGIDARSTGRVPVIRNNIIQNNQTGVVVANRCAAQLIQNLIVNNVRGVALDAFVLPSPDNPPLTNAPLLLNNTIVSELPSSRDGLSINHFEDIGPTVLNNIVVGIPALSVIATNQAVLDQVQSNDFFSLFGVRLLLFGLRLSNNITGDPSFVCIEGDYHLQPLSPCIDAGINNVSNLPAADLEGRPRIITGSSAAVVDLGVFESDPAIAPADPCVTIICLPDAIVHVPFGTPSAIVTFPTPYASPGATVTCSPPSQSSFLPGTNVVTCTAVSTNGSNWCSFNVVVLVQPPNDDFDDATVISSLPFTDILDATGATSDFQDPHDSTHFWTYTVWYQIKTRTRKDVYLSTFGSDYNVNLSVYTGTSTNLTPVASDYHSLKFTAQPNRKYYIMAASAYTDPAGHLEFRALTRPPFKATVVLQSVARMQTPFGPTLTATVRTSRPLLVSIQGTLDQKTRSGAIVHGNFTNSVSCDGQTTWSAVTSGFNTFETGLANAHMHISAYDPDTGEYVNTDQSGRVLVWRSPTLGQPQTSGSGGRGF